MKIDEQIILGFDTLKETKEDIKTSINTFSPGSIDASTKFSGYGRILSSILSNIYPKKEIDDGKALVATAITEKGVSTQPDASFETMAENIGFISGGGEDVTQVIKTLSEIIGEDKKYTTLLEYAENILNSKIKLQSTLKDLGTEIKDETLFDDYSQKVIDINPIVTNYEEISKSSASSALINTARLQGATDVKLEGQTHNILYPKIPFSSTQCNDFINFSFSSGSSATKGATLKYSTVATNVSGMAYVLNNPKGKLSLNIKRNNFIKYNTTSYPFYIIFGLNESNVIQNTPTAVRISKIGTTNINLSSYSTYSKIIIIFQYSTQQTMSIDTKNNYNMNYDNLFKEDENSIELSMWFSSLEESRCNAFDFLSFNLSIDKTKNYELKYYNDEYKDEFISGKIIQKVGFIQSYDGTSTLPSEYKCSTPNLQIGSQIIYPLENEKIIQNKDTEEYFKNFMNPNAGTQTIVITYNTVNSTTPYAYYLKGNYTIYSYKNYISDTTEGKTLIANAITNKGILTDANASFEEMSENIANIPIGPTPPDFPSWDDIDYFELPDYKSLIDMRNDIPTFNYSNFANYIETFSPYGQVCVGYYDENDEIIYLNLDSQGPNTVYGNHVAFSQNNLYFGNKNNHLEECFTDDMDLVFWFNNKFYVFGLENKSYIWAEVIPIMKER